ncbi:recombinase family protein [Streptomyces sp. NBC_01244]|uniref:recombinase family protein n=1 Tax=Streptomyces sp. NBC_01244 TaxID=2903797 RepID=UPI002E0E4B1C|nr:recombinase family protein [Streptomyces sp. NBC_01244]
MNEAAPVIPVVSYARISADTARDGHGVEDQHKVNGETAARLGWTIVHRCTDNDLSAAKAAVVRPDFEAMVKALKSGHMPDGQPVRGVIVVADDRLTRRAGDYERFVDALTYEEGRLYADAKGSKNQDAAAGAPLTPRSRGAGHPGGWEAPLRLAGRQAHAGARGSGVAGEGRPRGDRGQVHALDPSRVA